MNKMTMEEFEETCCKYIADHPRMSKDDQHTYDTLINEYMCTCKCTNEEDKKLFPYPLK